MTHNAQQREAIDVGHEIAAILQKWRPDMNQKDVAIAVMHALERLSINIEGPGESNLSGILLELKDQCDKRIMSI